MSAGTVERLVLFGATGDLAGRFLLPALAQLTAADLLPEGFEVVGAARQPFDDEGFRRFAAAALDRHAADVPLGARDALLRAVHYRPVDLADPANIAAVVGRHAQPVAAYLALPPAVFPTAVRSLGAAGLPAGSRIVLEKPFGEDLASAIALNELVAEVSGEENVFRVDHVLGLATLHNLVTARLSNRLLEPLWNSRHIERIDILWDETLGLEGRAGYYDDTGALKDVVQNHLLQILCLLAMEPPAGVESGKLRERKIDVLRSVRRLTPDEVVRRTTRARYTAGRLGAPPEGTGAAVDSYVDEDGVDPARATETFAEILLEVDSPRWSGTTFLLRTGKAMTRRRKGVVVRLRPVEPVPFLGPSARPPGNELRIGLDGPESLTLHLTGSAPGPPPRLAPLEFAAEPPADQLPAYSHVLLDVLRGGDTLSVSGEEAELAWRIVTPILETWAAGEVPLQEYPAGSDGPLIRLENDRGTAHRPAAGGGRPSDG